MTVILYTALFSSFLRPPLCCTAVSCTTSETEMRIYLFVSPAIKRYLQKGVGHWSMRRKKFSSIWLLNFHYCVFFNVFSLEQSTTKCWSLANASMFKYLFRSTFFIAARLLYLRIQPTAGRKYLGGEGRVNLYQICPDFLSSSKVPK